MLETAAVLLALELIGLAALPLSLRAFRRLPLAGAAMAKPLGLLVLAWLVWVAWAAGVPNGLPLAAGAAAVLAGTAVALRPSRAELSAARGHLLACEGLFVAAFLVCALFNAFVPAVWGTEKPMDMMLVNATLASADHPPHDAWMAGTDVNYYYLGHLAAGLLIRFTGVEPTVGYNLALAAVFALSAVGAYGLAAAVARAHGRSRPWLAGAAAVALALLLGSVRGGVDALRHTGDPAAFEWFAPSRLIPGTINEFPFFSFLLGDLHAHVLALPFTLLALGFVAIAAIEGPPRLARWETPLAALSIAMLYAINSWSWPVVAGLHLLALLARAGRGAWSAALVRWLGMVGLGAVLILPFLIEFDPNARGLGVVGEREPLGDFARHHVEIYGTLAWAVAVFYVLRLGAARRPLRLGVGAVSLLIVGLFLLDEAGVAGAAALAALAAVALHALFTSEGERVPWLLVAGGLICLLVPELVRVRDEFDGGELERMNTVFKMGYQAWVLLAVAGGLAVAWAADMGRVPRALWGAGLLGLALVGGAYTVAGSYARKEAFAGTPSLDGRAWLARVAPGDVRAIDWLRRNARGEDVVLEAVGEDYSAFGHGRISTYTGLQTLMGWEGHVLQFGKDPGGRRADVRAAYTSSDPRAVRWLLRRHRVRFVVLGPLERTEYGDAPGVTTAGRRVFDREGTAVYEFDVPARRPRREPPPFGDPGR